MTIDELKTHASPHWLAILEGVGIPKRYLDTRRHQPCPACGGRDRYRFTNYQNSGGFICNQCTPQGGSGFDLIMLVFACDFTEAVKMVKVQLGIDANNSLETPRKRFKPFSPSKQSNIPKDNLKRLQGFLSGSQSVTEQSPVGQYLIGRGLDWRAIEGMANLFYHPKLDYWTHADNKPVKVGAYPAMLACIKRGDELVGIHVTYLEKPLTGENRGNWQKLNLCHPEMNAPLPAKKIQTRYPGALKGACVPLYPPPQNDGTKTLAVCEGIETALAVRELFYLPVVACCSAWGLRNISLDNVGKLYVVADNDRSNTGQKAGQALIRRALEAGIKTKYYEPPFYGDALDELNRLKESQTARLNNEKK